MSLGRCATASLVAVLAGCTVSGTDAPPETTLYSRSDLARVVAVAPPMADWAAWPKQAGTRTGAFTREDLAKYRPSHESQGLLADAQAKAGFLGSRDRRWQVGSSTASSSAAMFATADGARDAIDAHEEFAHAWFTDVDRASFESLRADGLGRDAWGVRGGRAGFLEFVQFGWRRGNLVFDVYVGCEDCASNVEQVARDWATAIDERAGRSVRRALRASSGARGSSA